MVVLGGLGGGQDVDGGGFTRQIDLWPEYLDLVACHTATEL